MLVQTLRNRGLAEGNLFQVVGGRRNVVGGGTESYRVFGRVRRNCGKATISIAMSVRPSHETTLLPLNGFS
jgi:hypothetical protein